jgi:hypothetical protein
VAKSKQLSAVLVVIVLAATLLVSGCSLLPFSLPGSSPGTPSGPVAAPSASSTASVASTASAVATYSPTNSQLGMASVIGTQVAVPDVRGMDALAARKALKVAGLQDQLKWSGDSLAKNRRIIDQDPMPGTLVSPGQRIIVEASVGKGIGRPFPIEYLGSSLLSAFVVRSVGTKTTREIFFDDGYPALVMSNVDFPVKVYLVDDDGHSTLMFYTKKSGDDWTGFFRFNFHVTEGQYMNIKVVTPASRYWELRYAVYPTEDAAKAGGTATTVDPGGGGGG